MPKETRLDIDEFSEKMEGLEPYTCRGRKSEDGKCVFPKDNLCPICGMRSLVCRFYPFLLKSIGMEGMFTAAQMNA